MDSNKSFGLYVHIPFCKSKCAYCDFVSFANKEGCIKKYIDALIREIEYKSRIEEVQDYVVDTIYIGGGTPSFIESKYIQEILKTIKEKFNVKKDAEITIEINPGTIDENNNKQKIIDYKNAGINRISIGLQSTDDNLLKEIGRIHTYEQFLNTYSLIREAGFKNVNIDLMIGLPNQSLKKVEESLNNVIELNPEHISVYSLILEENTPLEKRVSNNELQLPDEELERKMYWKVKERLEEKGYKHYEISNFAKEGFESKHNMNCWNQDEYLGFGLAAHSYLQDKRFCNTSDINLYINNIINDNDDKNNSINNNIEICEVQDEKAKKKEYMLLGLRKIDGVDIQEFKNRFIDNPIYLFHTELEKLVKEELVEVDFNSIKLTNKGLDLANLVWEEFV